MPLKKPNINFRVAIITPLAIAGVVALLSVTGVTAPLDGYSYDLALRAASPPQEHPDVVLLSIDDRAIEIAGTWPFRRDVVADAVVLAAELGLETLVFDIEYVDPSPAVADRRMLSQELPERTEILHEEIRANTRALVDALVAGRIGPAQARDLLTSLEEQIDGSTVALEALYSQVSRDSDDYLGRALALFGSAYVTANLAPGVELAIHPALRNYYLSNLSLSNVSGALSTIPEATALLPTIEPVVRGAAGAGFTNIIIDNDGVRRRVHLIQRYRDSSFGQLVFVPVLDYLGNPPVEVTASHITIQTADPIVIPRDVDGTVLLRWPQGEFLDSFRHVSFGALLEHNNLVDALFRNIEVRFNLGYLDDVPVDRSPLERVQELRRIRRTAVFSGATEGLELYRQELTGLLADLAAGISDDPPALVTDLDDYRVWSQAVRNQVSDIQQIRSNLAGSLAGGFAILGNAATGTTDFAVTPFSSGYPAYGTHGVIANMILTNDVIQPTPWWTASLLGLAVNVGLVFTIRRKGPVASLFIDIVWVAVGVAGLAALLRMGNVYVSAMPLVVGNLTIYAIFTVIKFYTAEKEKSYIKNAFSQYLSKSVMDDVLEDPTKLSLGGEKREMSALFSDIRGFSPISERLTPEQLVALLNRYLTSMSDIILDEQGTIDKYEGDAIIAFFGAPMEVRDHAERACRSAILMKRVEQELNQSSEMDGQDVTLLTRIGVNSGEMVVGNMGTDRKMNYTIMGNAVNLAARLEGVNKQYGTWTLASEHTVTMANGAVITRPLDRVRVVGIHTPVRVFELVDLRASCPREVKESVEIFTRGLKLYESASFTEACKLFAECRAADGTGGPADVFYQRCTTLAEQGTTEDWDAVITLSSK